MMIRAHAFTHTLAAIKIGHAVHATAENRQAKIEENEEKKNKRNKWKCMKNEQQLNTQTEIEKKVAKVAMVSNN